MARSCLQDSLKNNCKHYDLSLIYSRYTYVGTYQYLWIFDCLLSDVTRISARPGGNALRTNLTVCGSTCRRFVGSDTAFAGYNHQPPLPLLVLRSFIFV